MGGCDVEGPARHRVEPASGNNEVEELSHDRSVRDGAPGSDDDELAFCSSQAHVDATTVPEKVASLKSWSQPNPLQKGAARADLRSSSCSIAQEI